MRMEPPVSVPRAPQSHAGGDGRAGAAAGAAGDAVRSQGLRGGAVVGVGLVAPKANSCMFSLPRDGAGRAQPRRPSRPPGDELGEDREPAVVRTPAVEEVLEREGMPWRGPL